LVIAKLFSSSSSKFCLNWLRFSDLITKCVGLVFFLDILWTRQLC